MKEGILFFFFLMMVLADSCKKSSPSSNQNDNICVTRLSPTVADGVLSAIDMDSIDALFSANNLSTSNLQFRLWQTNTAYQEQVTAVPFFNGIPYSGSIFFSFNLGKLVPHGISGDYTGPIPPMDTVTLQNFAKLRNAFLAHVSESVFTNGGAYNDTGVFVPSASNYVNTCLTVTLQYFDVSFIPGNHLSQNTALVKVWLVTTATSTSTGTATTNPINYYPTVYVEDDNGLAWGVPFGFI
jgi:hypothetical protein